LKLPTRAGALVDVCQNGLSVPEFESGERRAEGGHRQNAARRLMGQKGIRGDQVTQVRGFADQRLRKKNAPLDPSNRRISLIVQYLEKKAPGEPPTGEGKPGADETKEEKGSAKAPSG
jgi:hypothetical protein